jgi:hypothetical protein
VPKVRQQMRFRLLIADNLRDFDLAKSARFGSAGGVRGFSRKRD